MNKISFIFLSIIVFFSMMGFFTIEGHTIVIKKEMEDLTRESDFILIGEVKDMQSRWDKERRWIFTYAAISVRKYIKKPADVKEIKEIIVRVLGGEVGDIGLKVSDTPEFVKGEKVFLFLTPGKEMSIFRVTGLFQGKYTIEDGKVKSKALEQEVSLDSFVDQIQQIMQKAKGGQ